MSALNKKTKSGPLASLNDDYKLGDEPLLLGHITSHPGLVGVVGAFGGFITLAASPTLLPAYILALVNDWKYAVRKDSGEFTDTATVSVQSEEIQETNQPVATQFPQPMPKADGFTDYEQVTLSDNAESFMTEPLTNEEWVDRNSTVSTQQPAYTPQPVDAAPSVAAIADKVAQQKATIVDYTQAVKDASRTKKSIPIQMAETLESLLIIGNPGAGKGMLVSNAIAHVKELNPGIKVVGIDPKNDPKETGYWTTHFDRVHRISHESLDDTEYIEWFKERIQEFKDTPEDILYVIDEWTITCRKFMSIDKKGFESFISFMIGVSSSGDSRRKYVWGVGQIPHNNSMGMNGGDRSIFKPVAIVSKKRKDLASQFINTSFVPSPDNGMITLEALMDKSEVDRAIFYNEWQPLDRLHNYSGYDRDTRSWVSEPEKPMATVGADVVNTQLSFLEVEPIRTPTVESNQPDLDSLMGDMLDLDSLMDDDEITPIIVQTDFIDGVIKQSKTSPKKQHQCLGEFLEHLKTIGHGNTFKASEITGSSKWATKWQREGLLPDRKVESISKFINAATSLELISENSGIYTVNLR